MIACNLLNSIELVYLNDDQMIPVELQARLDQGCC